MSKTNSQVHAEGYYAAKKMKRGQRLREFPQTRRRRLKLTLNARRKGAATHGFEIEWTEPEEKALETYEHFHTCLRVMLKAHGLMGGAE